MKADVWDGKHAAMIGAVALGVAMSATGVLARERTVFIESAVEHADDTATLPLYRGRTLDGRASEGQRFQQAGQRTRFARGRERRFP